MDHARPLLIVVLALLATGLACTTDEVGTAGNSAGDDRDVALEDIAIAQDAGDGSEDVGSNAARESDVTSEPEPDADASPPDAIAQELPPSQIVLGPADRPATALFPDNYDGARALPVIFLFHGYTNTSQFIDDYFDLSAYRHEREFIIVLPDGLEDTTGQQFWNATDFCCDHYGAKPDDVGYFVDLLDELLATGYADGRRVHLMGHSNGHFFANRLACDHGSRIASVVGIAGGGHWDAQDCPADGQVSTLHIHSSSDGVVLYSGVFGLYRGAQTMARRWAERNGCGDSSSIYDTISIASLIWGDETTRRRYDDCPEGIAVELWTIFGGSHLPVLQEDVTDRLLDFALTRTNGDHP